MIETHLYITVDSISPKQTEKHFGYVLECEKNGEVKTVDGKGKVIGTYHGAVMQAIIEAAGRFKQKCVIYIHTENEFVLNMLETNLEKWSKNGFVTTKGKPVANKEQWLEIWKLSKKQKFLGKPGTHEYSTWLIGELEKEKKNV